MREWPNWPWAAAFTLVVSLLALGAAATARRRPGPAGWLGLGVAGPALGVSLWMLAAQVSAFAMGAVGWLHGGFLLAIAVAGGGLLVLGLAGRLPPDPPAALHVALRVLPRPREWDVSIAVGALRALALVGAALAALLLALDGRYRDFPPLAYWPAAAALALIAARAGRRAGPTGGSEEAWLAALLLVCGLAAIDHPGNREALAWAAVCAALALPLLGTVRAEAARLVRSLVPSGQQEAGEESGRR